MDEQRADRASGAPEDPNRLFREYGPTLIRYLSVRVGNRAEAQDLAQEAYLRLSRVANPDLIERPADYLFRIAANLANELLLKRRSAPSMIDLDTLTTIGGDGDGDQFSADMEARNAIQALERLLADIPPLYREILLLRKRDGYSHAEIAEAPDGQEAR